MLGPVRDERPPTKAFKACETVNTFKTFKAFGAGEAETRRMNEEEEE